MSTDYLTQNEKTRLLDLLFDGNVTLEGAEKKFKELFPVPRFPVASKELKVVARDLIFSCDGLALITTLYVVDVMRRAECVPAKALLFDILVELEKAIRKDLFLQEQIKYASKEVKDNRKSVDAVHADELRMHCAAKVFIFDLLGGKLQGDTKPAARLAVKQDVIDSALDAWEKSSMSIKEALADISYCWTSDKEKQRCGAPLENGAVFDNIQPQRRSAVGMRDAPVKVPSLPVTAGEMQFLLPGQKSFLLFDSEAPTPEWVTAKNLLGSAATSTLSQADRQTLTGVLSHDVVKHMEVSDKLICDITEHNPEVCAVILSRLPVTASSPRLQALITSGVSKSKVGTVLVNAPNSLEQVNVRTFIAESVKMFQEKPNDTESVKDFINCLYHLVTECVKENKDLYIADAVKGDLEKLIKSADVPELTLKWDEMKA